MSDKHHPDQPPNPSRRRLFSIFTDRKAAGELGAELGKLYHDAQVAADELAQVGQEMAGALADAVAPQPPTPEPAQLDLAPPDGDDEPEIETAVEAAAAELAERIAALSTEQAANAEQTRQLLESVTQQLRGLNDNIAALQQSPDPQAQVKAGRLDKVRGGLWAALSGSLGYLVTRTGEALYDGWVQANLLPLLPEWVQRPWQAFARGEQPSSPLEQPVSPVIPESPLESPLPTPEPHVQRAGAVRVLLPEMVYVPAGWFLMGSDKRKDPQAYERELPQHWVWLDAYWIGKYPITNAQYAAFVRATGHRAPPRWEDGRIPAGKELHPVVHVIEHDARAYCNWLSKYTRRSYRLPSEAEWEKAARGTDGRIYPWGNQPPHAQLCNIEKGVRHTTPVGAYPAGASPYGALDMAGNVWEWTNSLWGENGEAPTFRYPYDAKDGREQSDAPDSTRRVLRGGSVSSGADLARCAFRLRLDPNLWGDLVGFRVVASPFTSGR